MLYMLLGDSLSISGPARALQPYAEGPKQHRHRPLPNLTEACHPDTKWKHKYAPTSFIVEFHGADQALSPHNTALGPRSPHIPRRARFGRQLAVTVARSSPAPHHSRHPAIRNPETARGERKGQGKRIEEEEAWYQGYRCHRSVSFPHDFPLYTG